MRKNTWNGARKIWMGVLCAILMSCAVSFVLIDNFIDVAYAGEYTDDYVYEAFNCEDPWDSAFADGESGATITLIEEGISGKSLKIEGVEGAWTEYMYLDLPLCPQSVYTVQFKYKTLASGGDFTIFTRNVQNREFLEAFHFTYAGGVEFTQLEKNAYQIDKADGYYIAQVSFKTDEAANSLGFGMEGAGIIILDDIIVQKGGYLLGSAFNSGKELLYCDFETLGFYGTKFQNPESDQTKMFTNVDAINGKYSLRSVAEMPYWSTIFATKDNIGFSAGKVYTLSFKYKVVQPLKPGEFFYVESTSASGTSYMRFLDNYSIFEQNSTFIESEKNNCFGRNNYVIDTGKGYGLAKYTFVAVDSNTVVKVSKGDILGNALSADAGMIVIDDVKINEGITPCADVGALKDLSFEVFAESQYNGDFNAVQAFDESDKSRWVPAPRASWADKNDGTPQTFRRIRQMNDIESLAHTSWNCNQARHLHDNKRASCQPQR